MTVAKPSFRARATASAAPGISSTFDGSPRYSSQRMRVLSRSKKTAGRFMSGIMLASARRRNVWRRSAQLQLDQRVVGRLGGDACADAASRMNRLEAEELHDGADNQADLHLPQVPAR